VRWTVILGAAIILLAAAVGYFIGRQSGPASTSGAPPAEKTVRPALKKTEPAPKPGASSTQKSAQRSSKGVKATKRTQQGPWFERVKVAPDKTKTPTGTDQPAAQTASGTGPDPQILADQVVASLDDPNPRLRREALERLESVDHPAVNAALSKGINDADEWVRETAIDVMAEIGSPNILDTLAEALSSGDEYLSEAALDILEDIPDPRTVDILIEKGLLNDNAEIQQGALGILEGFTDQEFSGYQDASRWWALNRESFQFDE
jgi:HEAT repeat protein